MDVLIHPSTLSGVIPAVASKSAAHRIKILNALAPHPAEVVCHTTSADIEATERCLAALAGIEEEPTPDSVAGRAPRILDVGESGSTLRFLLPVLGALSAEAYVIRHGRLASRPLSPFDDELRSHGMTMAENGADLMVAGTLRGGTFTLPGSISSQYVSGLLLAAPLIDEACEVLVTTPVESRPYVEMTIRALATFGVTVTTDKVMRDGVAYERFRVGTGPLAPPERVVVEGDWSNAAFWLCAGALEREGLTVTGLDNASPQGDRMVLAALASLGARIARKGDAARASADNPRPATLSVSAIPDLVPPLAAVAATTPGTSVLKDAGRLRLKESDRLETVTATLNALGGYARIEGDALVIEGTDALAGGVVDAAGDHRIAMMAAICATHARSDVVVRGAECVSKSYPTFWDDYVRLKGRIETSA